MHDLVFGARRQHAGRRRGRAVPEAHHGDDLRSDGAPVEIQRLLAASVEHEIGADLDRLLFHESPPDWNAYTPMTNAPAALRQPRRFFPSLRARRSSPAFGVRLSFSRSAGPV